MGTVRYQPESVLDSGPEYVDCPEYREHLYREVRGESTIRWIVEYKVPVRTLCLFL